MSRTLPASVAAWLAPARLFLVACAGWLLAWPLTRVVRRRPNLVAFFGRDGGKFSDNAKHLFAALQDMPSLALDSVFLARDDTLRDRLRALGARAETVGSARAWWAWLRAGTIVVDSIDWIERMRFAGSRGARIVQLWHGIPLKRLQLPLFEERLARMPALLAAALRLQRAVIGRFARTEWFLSTSRAVTEAAFAQSFRYARISHAGYPRNDVLPAPGNRFAELGADVRAAAAVAAFRATHPARKVGLYAPTFRDALVDPFASGKIDLQALSRIATTHDMLLLVKLHPWMHGRLRSGDLPGVLLVAPESDAYPLLRDCDFLVTDYSSIFFDYLLLDRPVVFYPYDLTDYLANERTMYFDYDAMTPGPKATTLAALEQTLAAVAAGRDDDAARRAQVRAVVFDAPAGGAGERLLREVFAG
jgi:CDP-glycerol glycerophosphotransferase